MAKIGWIDSHCHIFSDEYRDCFDEVIKRAEENQVVQMLGICCTIEECEWALSMEKKSEIDIAVGFHPSDIKLACNWERLEELVRDPRIVAVGEIGLDYYWDKDNKEQQKEAFIRQIELANKVNKPIIVHSRDAMQDTIEILMQHSCNRKGIIHCYSGSVESAKILLNLGYTISFAGPVTFKKSVTPKEVATMIPLDRILTETDCPYMTPEPFRGKRNEPSYVPYTAKKVCELKNLEEEAFQKACLANYQALFHSEN